MKEFNKDNIFNNDITHENLNNVILKNIVKL